MSKNDISAAVKRLESRLDCIMATYRDELATILGLADPSIDVSPFYDLVSEYNVSFLRVSVGDEPIAMILPYRREAFLAQQTLLNAFDHTPAMKAVETELLRRGYTIQRESFEADGFLLASRLRRQDPRDPVA